MQTTFRGAAVPSAGHSGSAPDRLRIYWALTLVAFACFILDRQLGARAGIASPWLGLGGAVGCGFSWLMTRALFDGAARDVLWPRLVVLMLVTTGALPLFASEAIRPISDLIANTHSLAGSAVLLMILIEPFHGYRRDLPAPETQFRLAFGVVYAALLATSTLMLRQPDTAAEQATVDLVKSVCAGAGIVASSAAGWFRLRHPLPAAARRVRTAARGDDGPLAEQILRLLRDERLHCDPSLKVADLARRTGQPEYRVSQCITTLGFANFNRLINHHRIAMAKAMLTDPMQAHRPILLVAFDCGFASVGPFNRAFKAEVGVTPRAFRAGERTA